MTRTIWSIETKPVLALLLTLTGVVASACGSGHATTSTVSGQATTTVSGPASTTVARSATTRTATTGATAPPQPATTRRPPRAPLPAIGTAVRVPAPGTSLIVTIRAVIDPLRDSGAQVPPGTKAVGVLVSVRNAGPGGYDSSATGDFTLNSAAGQAAPLFVPAGQCKTPLQDFMNAIGGGELRTGCVAFTIPNGQRPTTVGFAPDGGSTGRRRLWAVR
jgi:hypothetical protein